MIVSTVVNSIKRNIFGSLLKRNILLITFLLVFPIGSISLVMYDYNYKITQEEIKNTNLSSLERVGINLDNIFAETERLSILIASNIDVERFLLYPGIEEYDYVYIDTIHKIRNLLNISAGTRDYIDSVFVYSYKSNMFISIKEIGNIDNNNMYEWYRKSNENTSMKHIWFSPVTDDGQKFIANIQQINVNLRDRSGVIAIYVQVDKLAKQIGLDRGEENDNTIILDEQNNIIYSKDRSLLGLSIDSVNSSIADMIKKGQNSLITDNNFQDVISIYPSAYKEWKYISIKPLQKYNEKTNRLKNQSVILIALCLVCPVILAVTISVNTFWPIKNIISLIKSMQSLSLNQDYQKLGKYSELNYIMSNIINTHDDKRKMETELKKRVEMLNSAKGIALQSQINPHFLYNTLETINWTVMGMTKSKNAASNMITCLSKLLRISLEKHNELVLISRELEHVRLYLQIQKYRYEDKISIVWNINNDIVNYKILSLILQPIVENAIYHGIKEVEGNGIIEIMGDIDKENIILVVKDNGKGIEQEALERLSLELSSEEIKESDHLGLTNVNLRIKLMFGSAYGISLKSEPGKGTEVYVLLPQIS